MLLPDRRIKRLCEMHIPSMIEPFIDHQVREVDGKRVISYGLSSYGYDIRVGNHFKVFSNAYGAVVDPKQFSEKSFVTIGVKPHEAVTIPPNSFALAQSVEKFKMPDNITAICMGKSTLARCGIIVNITPLEAGWEGVLTIEISNTTPLPARIYACEGIAQLLFFESEPCMVTYAQRSGKYQGQTGITLPKV